MDLNKKFESKVLEYNNRLNQQTVPTRMEHGLARLVARMSNNETVKNWVIRSSPLSEDNTLSDCQKYTIICASICDRDRKLGLHNTEDYKTMFSVYKSIYEAIEINKFG